MHASSPNRPPVRPRRRVFAALVTAVAALFAPVTIATPAHAVGGFFQGVYTSVLGVREYRGYVPSSYRPGTPMPLLVALHGCTENDVGFDVLSGWSTEAQRRGFIAVFPEQSSLANPAGCWNWFLETNQHRGWGEPAIIAGIADTVRSRYSVDPRRIYVTGVSAGGVMANIMAVTYPDVFAAAGILAGCEYDCDVRQRQSPAGSGQQALDEMGSRARPVPAVVFQGTADVVVPPSTAYRIVGQWATVDGIDPTADAVDYGQVPGGRSYTHLTYRSASGQALIEQYMIDGAGHMYPGGCSCSLYGDPSGPNATGITWDFFLAHPRR